MLAYCFMGGRFDILAQNSNFVCTVHGIGCGIQAHRCNRRATWARLRGPILDFIGKVEAHTFSFEENYEKGPLWHPFLQQI